MPYVWAVGIRAVCDAERQGSTDAARRTPDEWHDLYGTTYGAAPEAFASPVTIVCDAPSCREGASHLVRPRDPIEDVPASVRLCDEHTGLYLSAMWGLYRVRGEVSTW